MKICVVGAGVLGLATAYELSVAGHDVRVVDKDGPFAGASHRSFAWVNANNKVPSSYHRINAEGIVAHQKLQERLSGKGSWFYQPGNILVDFTDQAESTYSTRIADANAEGYPVERVPSSELTRLESSVAWPRDLDSALLYPSEGYLDNDILGNVLVGELSARNVTIELAEVVSISGAADRATVTFADGDIAEFDRVVIAAGAGSRAIADASGFMIPVADLKDATPRTHSLLGLTEPTDVGLSHVLISDRINVRPRHDGRLWVQVPAVEPRVAEGDSEELRTEVARVMEGELARLFGVRVPVEKVYFSGRSFPEDGVSIIGFVDNAQRVYTSVTHSGMTLAALFARLAVQELEGHPSQLLSDFRPSRFKGGIAQADDSYFIGKQ